MPDELDLVDKIAGILYRYDPVCLHSPKADEYKAEAFDIVSLWANQNLRPISNQELLRYIYIIFNLSFSSSVVNHMENGEIRKDWAKELQLTEKIIGPMKNYETLTKEIWATLCCINNGKESI